MQNSLYLFNPDHDLALANRDLNYMPPASARQLTNDLALFPVWYGSSEDLVLASSAYNRLYLDKVKCIFSSLPAVITEPELANLSDVVLKPWGWNPAIRKRLNILGIDERTLPSFEQLDHIYKCSHRSLAAKILTLLQLNDEFCGEALYLSSLESIKTFVEEQDACVLKAPVSGSGKGLNWCRGIFTPPLHNWCANILKQQGGIVAEPLYDKVVDFAMQFYADTSGKVSFAGYSLFYTNPSGAYEGNMLATDEAIESRLTEYVSSDSLSLLKTEWIRHLENELNGFYCGYLGVDMMICSFPDKYCIHPCVEINLRMNMGISARLFYDKYVLPGMSGVFRIKYHPSHKELTEEHQRMENEYPLIVSNERILQGYLPLVPVTPQSQYRAYVLINN